MTDFRTLLAELRRPRLLIRAARCGMEDYRRERDLKRLLRHEISSPERALPRLLDEEERLEQTRRDGDASYSLNRHIEVLIALLGEMRLLPNPAQSV
ncbi:MAG: DUF6477 family protein [Gemmobacter sp.]|jgi:hypothetical protein|nr:DUF6477 family protein [Gemmobacter sp.]